LNYYAEASLEDVRKVNSISELNLPEEYSSLIEEYLYNMAESIGIIDKVFLFGSCARGELNSFSDVDLYVMIKDGVDPKSKEVVRKFYSQYLPDVLFPDFDLLLRTRNQTVNSLNIFGSLIRGIIQEGVDLSEILRESARAARVC